MNRYPLFTPPEHLALIGSKAWKKKETQQYFDWFLNEKALRVTAFLAFLEYDISSDEEKDIQVVSQLLYTKINNSEFYTLREHDNAKKLNNAGLAMASDMGLFIAQILEKKKPSLYWSMGKGPKTYHSFNLPVLKEFSNGEWDLIFTAISKVGYSLNELRAPYDWHGFYMDLKTKAL